MLRLLPQRLLTVFAVLSLVSTLAASACPTCETAPAGSAAARDHDAATRFGDDWGEDGAACACCETDGCTQTDELPDGGIRRVVPAAPALLAVTVAGVLPPPLLGPAGRRPRLVPARERTRLHLRNESLLC